MLRSDVEGMSLDNFIMRPKRRFVEKFAKSGPWEIIGLFPGRHEPCAPPFASSLAHWIR